MINGTVCATNAERGMIAVWTEKGDFSVFELLSDDPVEIGDEVRWQDEYSLGSTMVRNVSQGERFEVYFQNHSIPMTQVRQQLLFS